MGKKKQRNKEGVFEVIVYICLAFQLVSFWAPIIFGDYTYSIIDYIDFRLPAIVPHSYAFSNFVILSYIFVLAGLICSIILFYKKRQKKFLIIFLLELVLLLMMIRASIELSAWSYM
jgi:hypothetical protein